MSEPNPYIMAKPGSLALRIAARKRREMFNLFLELSAIKPEETLLDVGVTAARNYDSFNYVEAWYPYKNRITAVGLNDASFLEKEYPGLTFKQASGLDLPYDDNSFDIVHSSAVLEHVGNTANQKRFISESFRVCRRGLFLTTPNRWYPIEFHTLLPLVHWLPKPRFRAMLQRTRYDFYSSEDNLNLLSSRELMSLVPQNGRCVLRFVFLLGWPSNLLLWIEKPTNA